MTGKRNKLAVKIAKKEYMLVSEESREYMLEVSDYVDRQMELIRNANPCMSTAQIAVLASVNIADECLRKQRAYEESAQKIIDYTKKVEALEEELDRVKARLAAIDRH